MLKNIEFKSYILDTIAFARTIVIKCEQLALLDNQQLRQYYKIDPGTDKSKWKYYLNLNGDYHALDDKMYVTSLDNSELIEFTKANLDIHLATKRAYRLGSYYYTRLVEKYQHQLILINGILNPIPPTESVPAKDYQILRYNSDYVLWNEYQLMPALQAQIDALVLGSFKTEYIHTDNLMIPALIRILYGSLISSILMIRKEADGTRYAHDFYIWSRLNSYGLSSVYKGVMNNKQLMWMYRNIDYAQRLLGRRQTFDKLLDVILTERGIPLTRYEMIQSTEDMTETLTPKPLMLSRPINLIESMGLDSKLWTIPQVVLKEMPLAIDNEINMEFGIADAEYATKYGLHSEVPSKVLESNLTDTTERDSDRLVRVLHNHWIYLTYQGLYNINTDITDPRSGRTFRLTTPQTVVLWHYLIDRSRGITKFGNIPKFDFWRARKVNPPNYQTLMTLGPKTVLTEQVCKDILKVIVPYNTLISPDTFFEKCKEIADGMWSHKKLYSAFNNVYQYSRRWNAVDACYATGKATIGSGTYDDFLTRSDLDFTEYTETECLDLAWAIWSKVTGWSDNSFVSVGERQRLLINIMKDLTSYTVQYIGSTETAEGQFNLPFMMSMDGDSGSSDGGTSLVGTDGEFLPILLKIKPEAELVANELLATDKSGVPGYFEALSIGCAKANESMTLIPIESPPQVNNVYMRMGLTLKEVVTDGNNENTLP
jgi:hypothetical protein